MINKTLLTDIFIRMNIRQKSDQIHISDSCRGCFSSPGLQTHNTQLSKRMTGTMTKMAGPGRRHWLWSVHQFSPSLTGAAAVSVLGLLEPWTQLPHRLESSLFLYTCPPTLNPLTNLMHSIEFRHAFGAASCLRRL